MGFRAECACNPMNALDLSSSARMDAKGRDATWYGEVYYRASVQDVIAIEDQPDMDSLTG